MYPHSYPYQQQQSSPYATDQSNNPFLPSDDQNAQARFPDLSHETNHSAGYQQQQSSPIPQIQQPEWNTMYNVPATQISPVTGKVMSNFPGGGNLWPSSQYASSISPHPQAQAQAQTSFQTQPSQQFQTNEYPFTQGYGSSLSYQSYQSPQPQQQYNQYGMDYSQYQQPQPTGYENANMSQFDPYSSLGNQPWGQTSTPNQNGYAQNPQPQYQQQQQQQQQQQSPSTPSFGSGAPAGQLHPRVYIRTYKMALEQWDQTSWKQLLNAFEALKQSWETRLRQLQMNRQQNQGYGYSDPGLDSTIQTAQANIDSAAASYFQMKEVLNGYKISADEASRKRVREAMNAGVTNLPGLATIICSAARPRSFTSKIRVRS